MARKTISAEKKLAAILRVLQEGAESKDEARRLNIAHQTMCRLVSAYAKKYPEADKRKKAAEAVLSVPPPVDPPAAPPAAAAPPPEDKPAENTGLIDAHAVKAAMEADGKVAASPAPAGAGLPPPPAPGVLSLSTAEEDMEVVEGISNQLMGWACRGMVFWMELRSGVQLPEAAMKRLHELYVITPTERAMLKPTAAHAARKIREWIGSSETVALSVGGSTLGGGLFDRYRSVSEAVAKEFEVQRPDLKAAAAEEERKRAAEKGGAA